MIAGLVSCLLVAFPAGDGTREAAGEAPAGDARRDGRLVRERPLRGTGDHRAAQRRRAKLENPIVVPAILSFLAYGSFGSTVKGLNDFPEDRMAGQRRAALLQLPHHGRAGDALHLVMGVCRPAALAGRLAQYAARCCGC